jgi:hypothetical protein
MRVSSLEGDMKRRLLDVWNRLHRLYRWYPVSPLLVHKAPLAQGTRPRLEALEDRLPPGDPTGIAPMSLLGGNPADPLALTTTLVGVPPPVKDVTFFAEMGGGNPASPKRKPPHNRRRGTRDTGDFSGTRLADH